MGPKKPRIVIIGAGMAGLTAANNLFTHSRDEFDLLVVEAGTRIGGRINTSEFGHDTIELGATWIHGVGGSPVYEIATRIGALASDRPWECMDGPLEASRTLAEDGHEVSRAVSEPISALFDSLMDFARGKVKVVEDHACGSQEEKEEYHEIASEALEACRGENGLVRNVSIGSFLRKGLEIYWGRNGCSKDLRRKFEEEAVFAMHENIQRTYTSAGDLSTLDFCAESEYVMCSGEEITIAKGYNSVIQSLASVLPPGTIQLDREVVKIEWHPPAKILANGHVDACPVTLHFHDGATIPADHVIVTVSLGVLKARTGLDSGLFSPPLPSFKIDAIAGLGFGTVNKLFLQLPPAANDRTKPAVLQMAFHGPESDIKNEAVPWWMRRMASLCPIHRNSNVLLAWFAGKEALHLETLTDDEIVEGVSSAVNSMVSSKTGSCNGNGVGVKFEKVLRSNWGSNPLFLGSYSYVKVGSSGDDLDALAEPLPRGTSRSDDAGRALQIMFAGEATHRTHYSTTHGAYFSGIREALRLLKHYKCV